MGNADRSSRWSRPPEDLSGERVLRNCDLVEFEGERRPSVGRMVLLSKLGQGGMGVVYHAVNPRLRTEVAVKLLPLALHAQQPGLVARFLREARLAARLRSPHLVSVLEVDEDDDTGCHFIVMEYVDGPTASGWLSGLRQTRHRGAAEGAALEICIAASKGLQVAHLEGIVHRDIKPANILVPRGRSGEVDLSGCKLSDLGLARSEAAERSLTGTQVAMGTPGYMAPEQATDAKRAKKPADVFSMGATLYALLTGRPPFGASSAAMALVKTVKCEFEPIESIRPDVSPATRTLIETCLRRSPSERFPDATALLEALEICSQAEHRAAETIDYTTVVASLVTRSEQGKPAMTDPPTPTPPPTLTSSDRLPTLDQFGAPSDGADSDGGKKPPSTAEVASEAYRMVVGPDDAASPPAPPSPPPPAAPAPAAPPPPAVSRPTRPPPRSGTERRHRGKAMWSFLFGLGAWLLPIPVAVLGAGIAGTIRDGGRRPDDAVMGSLILLLPSFTAFFFALCAMLKWRGAAKFRKQHGLRPAGTATAGLVLGVAAALFALIGCGLFAAVMSERGY